ncbi:GLIPR1-like protein 1 [Oopsacas minuta]|uniref:GLIPR1-like protein 1 n=1 Tax=Oopsacas minuta TaxID=111878 RepID=A0AAV7K9G1_9METZ|nr:GLIPR1-like protein 1 [Oopsacas minuta]
MLSTTTILAGLVVFISVITNAVAQLDNAEAGKILKSHNEYRDGVQPEAANMKLMKWSSCLEQVAYNYLSSCPGFNHNPNRATDAQALNCEQSDSVGENLYWTSSSSLNSTSAVGAWYNEFVDYNYESNSCSAVCGHYTQVVWANSYLVGCSKFDAGPNCAGDSGTYFLCNYSPAGNFLGQSPYEAGTQCSNCDAGFDYCVQGQCSETDGGGGGTNNAASNTSMGILLIISLIAIINALI